MWDFIRNNWLNIFLIIVTASALLVYIPPRTKKDNGSSCAYKDSD